jgi:hypothetical protein
MSKAGAEAARCLVCCNHQPPPTSAAGAPRTSATFFCDGTSTYCYSYVSTAMARADAAARCTQMGGLLAAWTSGAKQLEAERCVPARW